MDGMTNGEQSHYEDKCMSSYSYIRDGAEIYKRSFAIIRAESDLARSASDEEPVAVRVIYASGQVEAAADLVFSPGFVRAARRALEAGAPILCDAKMVASGITRARLPEANPGDLHIGGSLCACARCRDRKYALGRGGRFVARSPRRCRCRNWECADGVVSPA